METTRNFRSELHVAQQSRRDKLRVLHHTDHGGNGGGVEIYGGGGGNNMEQFSGGAMQHHHHHHDVDAGGDGGGTVNPDLGNFRPMSLRYGNLSYEQSTTAANVFSSDMLQYFAAANSQALLAHHHDSDNKRIVSATTTAAGGFGGGNGADDDNNTTAGAAAAVSFGNLSHNSNTNFSTWKSVPAAGGGGGAQESGDWVSCGTGIDVSHHSNPVFAVEGLKANNNASSSSPAISSVYLKQQQQQQQSLLSYGYQDFRSSSSFPSSSLTENIAGPNNNNNSYKHLGEMHFYHSNSNGNNSNVVTTHNGRKTGRVSNWSHAGNELVLLPSYTDHCNPIDYSDSKAAAGVVCGSGTRGIETVTNDNSNTQALSLSLSSVPSSKPADYLTAFSYGVKGCVENVDSTVVVGNSSGFAQRGSGPLGPFTGYATILKSSRFLRPAQQIMEEFCNVVTPKSLNVLDTTRNVINPSSDGVTGVESIAGAGFCAGGDYGGGGGGGGGGSSSTFYSTNEKLIREPVGLSSSNESYKPEYLQKKAKLMYMQDEVCKRYKNYHQQMEMVVSSFETVAGLSAATPYLSLALKTISRHFRSLRNGISDQLKNVRKALGEDLSSLTTVTTSSSKGGGNTSSSKQKVIDHQTLQKQKTIINTSNIRFFEPQQQQQQHVWRPQRGLPERAVAILRAWLFDHFLHPYPTDADKHMLASQTGLTRNQVSNWFINARVRVWKPMVEEIHTLETKGGVAEAGPSGGNADGKGMTDATTGGNLHHHHHQHSTDNQAFMNRLSNKQQAAADCSEMVSSTFTLNRLMNNTSTTSTMTWDDHNHDHEKRSRLLDCRIPGGGTTTTTTTMDGGGGSLMGFMPYHQQNGIGGLGAISLTLGLRQNNAEAAAGGGVQHENQLRRHFGDNIIYDFVG